MHVKPTLSVIIITYNEAHNIAACLESVSFADEIIVIDSGSQDKTVDIAKQYTDKVFVMDWPGYGRQKQRALDKASCEWVLSLDADERVSPALAKELQETLQNTSLDGFEIVFHTEYCGKLIRFGDWYQDRQNVLFKKNKAQFTENAIHESIQIEGKVGRLKSPIYHYAFPNLEKVLHKINQYSSLTAEQKFKRGKKASIFTALSRGLWTFFRGYILRGGFLDGTAGLMLAISNAEGSYYKYLKLHLLQKAS